MFSTGLHDLIWQACVRAADEGSAQPVSDEALCALPLETRRLPLRWLTGRPPPLARHATCLRLGRHADTQRWLRATLERGCADQLRIVDLHDAPPTWVSEVARAASGAVTLRIRSAKRLDWHALRDPLAGLVLDHPHPEAVVAILQAAGCAALDAFELTGCAVAARLELPSTLRALSLRHASVDRLEGPRALRTLELVGPGSASLPLSEGDLTCLEELTVSASGVSRLPPMPHLLALRAPFSPLMPDGVRGLDLARLETLDLSGTTWKDKGLASQLERCGSLRRLTLHGIEKRPLAFGVIAERLGDRLDLLDLTRSDVGDAFIDQWRRCHPRSRLTEMRLAHTRVTASSMSALLDGDWMPDLERLDLAGCPLGPLPENPPRAPSRVQRIDLDEAWLVPEGTMPSLRSRHLPELLRLSLTGAWMSAALADVIREHVQDGRLLGLSVAYPRGAEPSMLDAMLTPDARLVALDLRGWSPDDDTARHVPRDLSWLWIDALDGEALTRLLDGLARMDGIGTPLAEPLTAALLRDHRPMLGFIEVEGTPSDAAMAALAPLLAQGTVLA